jgi:hypothetical protein
VLIAVDLIQRPVSGGRQIRAVGWPFAIFKTLRLAGCR